MASSSQLSICGKIHVRSAREGRSVRDKIVLRRRQDHHAAAFLALAQHERQKLKPGR
jgi:hypothetical protein